MNARLSKKIRKKALHLLVEWIQLLVPEEEAKKINMTNIKSFMPADTHLFANNKIILSAYSYRWIIKIIKKILKLKYIDINNIVLKDIEEYSRRKNLKERGY